MAVELKMRRILLGLGSNQGGRLENLVCAVDYMRDHPGINLVNCSGVYETGYVGPGQQDDYLNACLEITSQCDLLELLDEFQNLEQRLGRITDGHMKPRPLDIDFLMVDDLELNHERLQIPHPRLPERLFVLEPLKDIAPEKKIPNSGETVASLCAKIRRKDGAAVTLRPDLVLDPGVSATNMED